MNSQLVLFHTGRDSSEPPAPLLTDTEAVKMLNREIGYYGFKGRVVLSRNLAARAMTNSAKHTLRIRKGLLGSRSFFNSLSHHEVGVHMLTAANGRLQPLKLLRIGLPKSTETQEGLAILSEYLSGVMTVDRLKEMAYRVVAVNMMLKGYRFSEVFLSLVEEHGHAEPDAFYLTARIFRGGGFTKDFLYLRGFKKLYDYYTAGKDLKVMITGKTSYEYREVLHEMMSRGILNKPTYITRSFQNPAQNSEILGYIIRSLK